MEEKEVNQKKDKEPGQQRLTYEQLNQACQELFQQNQQLARKLEEANLANGFARLNYLFKVVEFASTFKDPEFINSCIDEIKEALTIKEGDKAEE